MKDAAGLLRQGLRVAPDAPVWNPVRRDSYGLIHFYIAVQDAAEGKLAEAEEGYRRSLALRPAFPEAWFNLGVVLAGQDRQHDAYRAYVKAAALKEGFYEAHREAGLAALRGGGTPAEAHRALTAALALRPAGPDADTLRSLLAGGRDGGQGAVRKAP